MCCLIVSMMMAFFVLMYANLDDADRYVREANLGFGRCQSISFASQIAVAALCCLQYNILSVAMRFSDYETIGIPRSA